MPERRFRLSVGMLSLNKLEADISQGGLEWLAQKDPVTHIAGARRARVSHPAAALCRPVARFNFSLSQERHPAVIRARSRASRRRDDELLLSRKTTFRHPFHRARTHVCKTVITKRRAERNYFALLTRSPRLALSERAASVFAQ